MRWFWENLVLPHVGKWLGGLSLTAFWLATVTILKGLPTWALIVLPVPLWLASVAAIWCSVWVWEWSAYPTAHLDCRDSVVKNIRLGLHGLEIASPRAAVVVVTNRPTRHRERMIAKGIQAHIQFFDSSDRLLMGVTHAVWVCGGDTRSKIDLTMGESRPLVVIATQSDGKYMTFSGREQRPITLPDGLDYAVVDLIGENCGRRLTVSPIPNPQALSTAASIT